MRDTSEHQEKIKQGFSYDEKHDTYYKNSNEYRYDLDTGTYYNANITGNTLQKSGTNFKQHFIE